MIQNSNPDMSHSSSASIRAGYKIRVRGCLASNPWSDWFDNVSVTADESRNETLLEGQGMDMAAVYGLLSRLRDLALPLVSVHIETE